MRTSKSVSTYLTITVSAVLFVLGWALTSMIPANAHTVSTYYSRTWAVDPWYAFGDIDSPLDTAAAKTSIHTGDDEWESVANADLDFLWSGTENPNVMWLGSACTTVPSSGYIWILSNDITALGATDRCSTSTTIEKATIRLDDYGTTWYTGSSSSVPSGEYDLRSVIVHEFGHAGGFGSGSQKHFTGPGVCQGSTRQTMCSGLPTGTSYKRDLEEHDEHTFAGAY